ncbi:MAG: hypothetical protein WC666_03170 [Candidatus Paceibacterota bacterium]
MYITILSTILLLLVGIGTIIVYGIVGGQPKTINDIVQSLYFIASAGIITASIVNIFSRKRSLT